MIPYCNERDLRQESEESMWKTFSIGGTGSEGGVILQDEEYKNACRITLEKCPKYYAITCGVYGAIVHTVFCGFDDYQQTYNSMKEELQRFIDSDTSDSENLQFYEDFTSKF